MNRSRLSQNQTPPSARSTPAAHPASRLQSRQPLPVAVSSSKSSAKGWLAGLGCLGLTGIGSLAAAAVLIAVVSLGILVATKPDRSEHERVIRDYVAAQYRLSGSESDKEVFGKILGGILSQIGRDNDVDHINFFGFEYQDHIFVSEVRNPRTGETISVGMLNTVKMDTPN